MPHTISKRLGAAAHRADFQRLDAFQALSAMRVLEQAAYLALLQNLHRVEAKKRPVRALRDHFRQLPACLPGTGAVLRARRAMTLPICIEPAVLHAYVLSSTLLASQIPPRVAKILFRLASETDLLEEAGLLRAHPVPRQSSHLLVDPVAHRFHTRAAIPLLPPALAVLRAKLPLTAPRHANEVFMANGPYLETLAARPLALLSRLELVLARSFLRVLLRVLAEEAPTLIARLVGITRRVAAFSLDALLLALLPITVRALFA